MTGTGFYHLLKRMIRLIIFFLAGLSVISAGLLFLAIEAVPLATPSLKADAQSLARLRHIARKTALHLRRPGFSDHITLHAKDVEAGLSFAEKAIPNSKAFATLTDGQLGLQASIPLRDGFKGYFFNARLNLAWDERDDTLYIKNASLGRLPLPGSFVKALGFHVIDRQFGPQTGRKLENIIDQVTFHPEEITITYTTNETISRLIETPLIGTILGDTPPELVGHYVNFIIQEYKHHKNNAAPITPLLNKGFEEANRRSLKTDPVVENRALFLALGTTVGHSAFRRFAGLDGATARRAAQVNGHFTLAGRHDLARHFALAAALQAAMGDKWSETAGIYKELSDAWTGGSGFSFSDLLADQTGVHLAEVALSHPLKAKRTQEVFATIREVEYFPTKLALSAQEGLSSDVFNKHYGAIEGKTFQGEKLKIDQAIKSLPGFQVLNTAY